MPKSELKVVPSAERTDILGKTVLNKILLSLPDNEFQLIRPELEFLKLPHGQTLCEANRKIDYVHFPNGGLISLVISMEDSKTVEVGILGAEGFSGGPSIFGLTRSPICEMVQITGDGFRLKAATLRQGLPAAPYLFAKLGRYSSVLAMQISQTAACNRLHDIEQRLARWLLMAQDRVESDLVAITHEFLAVMLGTDRPTVSTAAGNLQRKKIIRYNRGAVTILNRNKLEASACECYGAIQRFNREIDLK